MVDVLVQAKEEQSLIRAQATLARTLHPERQRQWPVRRVRREIIFRNRFVRQAGLAAPHLAVSIYEARTTKVHTLSQEIPVSALTLLHRATVLFCLAVAPLSAQAAACSAQSPAHSVALIELYTSEGCSLSLIHI